ncbi:hypothetical protein [Spirosoma gilvum]
MVGTGYELTKAFYRELGDNEAMQMKAKPHHLSLYCWIAELRNRVGMDVVDLPREYTMKMSLIGSPSTLKTCIMDLSDWGIIEVLQWGKNDWTGATKVRFSCSFLNKYCTAGVQQQSTNKTNKTDKTGKSNTHSEFDLFWNHYGKKTGSKPTAIKEWNKLSVLEQQAAYEGIARYIAYQPDAQYRKDPERYLKHRVWESEFNLPAKTANPSQVPLFAVTQPAASPHKPFRELT